ncbi:unnamed protein product [Paramecium primaurelia]|uniref:Uncharacterized protein n=1 Tax=Paramecium primaurelia TaxID=5886 RepID=A0A8S1PGF8_PARPR|nr:unnamed protein product [Paramecium primaurelia]
MGSICKFAQNDQKNMNQTFDKVQGKNIPNKQQFLEKYSYNLQENGDKFEEDFFQKSFQFELRDQNQQIAEVISENLSIQGFSENNSIEITYTSNTESAKETQSLVFCKHYCIYKQNQQQKLQLRNKKSNFSNSPLKSILKMPLSYQRINMHCNEIQNLKQKKVRFKSSDKMSNSSGKGRPRRQMQIMIKSLKNQYT